MESLIEKAKQAKPYKKTKKQLADFMPAVDELRKNGFTWNEVKRWLEENAGESYNMSTLVNCYYMKGPYLGKDWRAKNEMA